MTLTESVRWLFARSPESAAHADRLNASMGEFDLKRLSETEKAKKDAYPPEDVQ
jgi:hypothetical protein